MYVKNDKRKKERWQIGEEDKKTDVCFFNDIVVSEKKKKKEKNGFSDVCGDVREEKEDKGKEGGVPIIPNGLWEEEAVEKRWERNCEMIKNGTEKSIYVGKGQYWNGDEVEDNGRSQMTRRENVRNWDRKSYNFFKRWTSF